MTLSMRVGLGQFNTLTDEKLAFIKQLGANDFLMNTPDLPGDTHWAFEDLAKLKSRADAADLRFMCLENVPIQFYDKIMLGEEGRDRQLEHMTTTVRHMGRAGIPILGYHGVPNHVWRDPDRQPLRGGAAGTRFKLSAHENAPLSHGREFSDEEMWDNYCWYLERILPVAEEAGVTLALHPDDPPVPVLGGIARICNSFDHFARAMDTFDSPNHGLDFCMGCWSEMGGHDSVIKAVRHFGGQGKIVYIHFRDVVGPVEDFYETFIDCGQVDTFPDHLRTPGGPIRGRRQRHYRMGIRQSGCRRPAPRTGSGGSVHGLCQAELGIPGGTLQPGLPRTFGTRSDAG